MRGVTEERVTSDGSRVKSERGDRVSVTSVRSGEKDVIRARSEGNFGQQ